MRKTLIFLLVALVLALPVRAQILDTGALTATSSDCSTAGSCVSVSTIPVGASSLSVQLTGTWSATVTFEATADGTNWTAVQAIGAGGTASTTATSNGIYTLSNVGFTAIRARASAYTSGTARVTITRGYASAKMGGVATTVLAGDGSASAPSIAFAAQPALGWYRSATNQMALAASEGLNVRFGYVHAGGTNGGMPRSQLFVGSTADTTSGATADNYMFTLYSNGAANQTGGGNGVIFAAIGQNQIVATDTATRTKQFANIEADITTITQTGGAVQFNDYVNTRFRYPSIGTSVTLVDNKGLDFVPPSGGSVLGTVTNYKAINFPDMSSCCSPSSIYGLFFDTGYTAHLATKSGVSLIVSPQGTGTTNLQKDALGSTATSGVKIINTTAATGGATVQMSPALVFSGQAWNSSGSASETDTWAIDALPATNAGATTVGLRFSRSINGGAASALVQFSSGGTITSGGLTSSGTVSVTGGTATLGYGSGSGQAVTQLTNKSTGVTVNHGTGVITMNNASLGANTAVGFTVTNSTVAATDTIVVSIASGATADAYHVQVDAVGSGSFRISIRNMTGGALLEAVVLNFAVIKGSNS